MQLTIRPLGLDATHISVVATGTQTAAASVNVALAELVRLCTEGPDVTEIVAALDRYERRRQLSPLQAGLQAAREDLLAALEFSAAPTRNCTPTPPY